ncbi:MAG: DUF501 domain-containing protein [Actinomycetota bacterium]|nr:DUF501 domain-containing protein [Actinomycetota bacterium]
MIDLHAPSTGADARDGALVEAQVGRAPRGPWSTYVRCGFGRPSVISSSPLLDDGTPFPTLYWLTCPWLVERVGALESSGEVAAWTRRLAADPVRAGAMRDADAEYRFRRSLAGTDPCSPVGIAGQRDPLAIKCLHAHVAAFLAGIADPIGEAVLGQIDAECPDDRCASLVGTAGEEWGP